LLQGFPNKALAVLWDFNGLQGQKTKMIRVQIYSPHRPPFSLIPGDITPYSASSPRAGSRALRGFAGDCIAGERERVHGSGFGVSGAIRARRNFDIARILITGKLFSTKNRRGKIDAALFQGKIAPDGAPSKAGRLRLDDRLYHLGDAQ
jgi:hypothetical protein